jgi:hypothetical protein
MSIPPGRRDSESVALVWAAPLTASAFAAEGMRQAGARDERCGADFAGETARQAVAAWVMAVGGYEGALASIASADTVHWLMNPVGKDWRVAPGPRVTGIKISGLHLEQDPPELLFGFRFEGRTLFADSGQQDRTAGGDEIFAGILSMTLPGSGPWQLTHGHVQTLDESLGYVFARRRESAAEYRQRVGWAPGAAAPTGPEPTGPEPTGPRPAGPGAAGPGAAGPGRGYLIVAGFAEHDERLGARAQVEVRRESAPTREEAEALIWPAVWEVTAEALGEGDWRPSLSWLDVVELSDQLPGV